MAPTNLTTRTLSGVIFAAVVTAATLFSPWTFGTLLTAIAAGCLWEFYRLASAGGAEPQKWFGLALGLVLLTGGWIGMLTDSGIHKVAAAAVLPGVFFVFIVELYRRREKPLLNVAATLTGGIYVILPLLFFFFMAVNGEGGTGSYRPLETMAIFLIVWANDTGAYLTGMAFGRHRLMERISPKKSWEGFRGGLVLAAGVAFLTARFIMDGSPRECLVWAGLGLVVAVAGVMGDLVESMFKRSVGVKDSGAMMPGHGGWLDRFDALLIALPFAFFYRLIFMYL